jgi:hypothetical protein
LCLGVGDHRAGGNAGDQKASGAEVSQELLLARDSLGCGGVRSLGFGDSTNYVQCTFHGTVPHMENLWDSQRRVPLVGIIGISGGIPSIKTDCLYGKVSHF